jgi:tetratricopeptide (TPR) repeat protein
VSDSPDFFISYNSQDDRWAQWIAWELEEAGYSVVVQAWDFAPGSNFVLEMQKAAVSATRTIAVLSPDFVRSAFAQPEWAAAFAKDPTGNERRLVPVRVAPVEVTGLLAQIVHVDLVGTSESDAKARLLSAAHRAQGDPAESRHKPVERPGFPGRATLPAPFPNELPDVWQVPRASRGFHGRNELLARITTTLTREPVVILTGLGGSGKSRLALKYIHDLRASYDVVYWVRAEDGATMLNDLGRLALQLDLTDSSSPDLATVLLLVQRWLDTHTRWCLVFDNAADPASIFSALPSMAAGGNVLVTSRHHTGWSGIGMEIPVPTWSRPEGRSFLLNRLGEQDENAAEQVSAALGDLPLALEQAAAYSEARSLGIRDYLERLKVEAPILFERGKPIDYEHTVATTWRLAFEQLEQDEPTAALLFVCAYLSADEIPRWLFRGPAFREASNANAPGAPDDAIANAQRFSLIEVEGSTLRMHRLVQAIVRNRREVVGGRRWAAVSVRVVKESFRPAQDVAAEWDQSSALLPHALAALDHATRTDAESTHAVELMYRVAVYLLLLHDASAAERLLDQVLVLLRQFPASPELEGDVLLRLGDAQQLLGRHREALISTHAAYVLVQQKMPRSSIAAKVLAWLGFARCEMGDFSTGIADQERALRMARTRADHERIIVIAINLAQCLVEDERWERALEVADLALEITREALSTESVRFAVTMMYRATALSGLGNTEAATDQAEESLAIAQASYPDSDPRLGNFFIGMGDLLARLPGRELEGERYLALAVKTMTDLYGPDHPRSAIPSARLGAALARRGAPESFEMLRRALGVLTSVYPAQHPIVRRARAALLAAEEQAGP